MKLRRLNTFRESFIPVLLLVLLGILIVAYSGYKVRKEAEQISTIEIDTTSLSVVAEEDVETLYRTLLDILLDPDKMSEDRKNKLL